MPCAQLGTKQQLLRTIGHFHGNFQIDHQTSRQVQLLTICSLIWIIEQKPRISKYFNALITQYLCKTLFKISL